MSNFTVQSNSLSPRARAFTIRTFDTSALKLSSTFILPFSAPKTVTGLLGISTREEYAALSNTCYLKRETNVASGPVEPETSLSNVFDQAVVPCLLLTKSLVESPAHSRVGQEAFENVGLIVSNSLKEFDELIFIHLHLQKVR